MVDWLRRLTDFIELQLLLLIVGATSVLAVLDGASLLKEKVRVVILLIETM